MVGHQPADSCGITSVIASCLWRGGLVDSGRGLLQRLFTPRIRPVATAAVIGPKFVVHIGDSMQGDGPAKTEEQWREVKTIGPAI